MEESTKKTVHQIEITVAVLLIMVSVIALFPNKGITGYISVETKSKTLNLTISNSQSYVLTTNNEALFYLTSIKVSGEVIGKGIAEMYVDNGKEQKALVYSNVVKKEKGVPSITGLGKVSGMAVGVGGNDKNKNNAPNESELKQNTSEDIIIDYLEKIEYIPQTIAEDEEIITGNFEGRCLESCFVEMPLSKDIAYQLLFYVDDGTLLKINKIEYTIKKD